MPTNNIISREQAEAIIREQVVPTIFQDAPKKSALMSLARKLPNMTSNQTRVRVLDLLPMAYWVNGDTGYKQTSEQAWANVYLNAAELAVIVPIPEAVLDDAEFDIIGEVTPRVNEAIAQRVDAAAIFGNNRPAEWSSDIVTRARQAGNNVAVGNKDWYDIIMSEGGAFDKVEELGYAVTGAIASMGMKAKLRGLRTQDGLPIYNTAMQGATSYGLDGNPLYFLDNGAFDKDVAQLIVGDFSQAVYSIRQDITIKILDQGVIQDPATKEIVYNLAQQDMIALRVVFRMGWALPNPATRLNGDRTGCPFAYIEPSTPVTTQTVTFTVTDGENAIANATVDVSGAILKTDASGQAVFNLRSGDYSVAIKAKGYKGVTDNITVDKAAITKDITLVAST
ncbi:MAG: phage major capsid protein [Oscillospiraceae bacterium]|nr:phage major capsid protein [Oscillospiraceae bacterium]